jgi:hypothetical protein
MQKNQQTNNDLYLERVDLVPHIMSYEAFIKNNQRNGAYWQMMQNPNDGRIPMVKFEDMRPSLKDKINNYYGGDVYAHFAKMPLLALVITDAKAETFYNEYRYDGDKQLPPEHQYRYTKTASFANMLIKAREEKVFVKENLGIKHIDKFWKLCAEIIAADNLELPRTYQKLLEKIDKYKEQGYACLIDWRFGNKNTAKLGKTENGFCEERLQQQLVVIKKLARQHMNLDPVQIASAANILYQRNGWATISPATVANLIIEHMPELAIQRKGDKWYNNKVGMQVKRTAPEFPSYYWTLDGWTVELGYQDGNRYDNRLVMVVVLDACNKYPVGYAIGERENTDLIRMALRNAVIHMQDLFGAAYRPWQLQSDRYGLKNLTPFYGAVSHINTPAAVGNAKSKIIEPYFKYLNKTYCQLKQNWTGFNITSSKENQPNIERLNQIKKTFPDKAGVIEQINRFMLTERLRKEADYKARWQAMPHENQVTLNPMQCIEVFGKPHTEYNSIIGHGLIATLKDADDNSVEITYDSFDPAFRELQFSTRFKLIYEPADLSQVVAITEDGKRKFLLHAKMSVGMGFMNTTPQQLEYRQQIRDFNSNRKQEILQTYISEDAQVIDIVNNTPLNINDENEAALKLMLTDDNGQQKERLQDAKNLKKVQQQTVKAEQKELKQIEQHWED